MLRDLARRLRDVPAMYGVDGFDIDQLRSFAGDAMTHAATLDSLIDGKDDDELGQVLAPIRDFLREISNDAKPKAAEAVGNS